MLKFESGAFSRKGRRQARASCPAATRGGGNLVAPPHGQPLATHLTPPRTQRHSAMSRVNRALLSSDGPHMREAATVREVAVAICFRDCGRTRRRHSWYKRSRQVLAFCSNFFIAPKRQPSRRPHPRRHDRQCAPMAKRAPRSPAAPPSCRVRSRCVVNARVTPCCGHSHVSPAARSNSGKQCEEFATSYGHWNPNQIVRRSNITSIASPPGCRNTTVLSRRPASSTSSALLGSFAAHPFQKK